MTGIAFVVAALAFALAGFGGHSVIALALAAIVIDVAVQASLILGQHTVYQLDPAARARLNSAFIAMFFAGGAAGSQLGSVVYHAGGWSALTVLGATLPLLALLYWSTERRRARRRNRARRTREPAAMIPLPHTCLPGPRGRSRAARDRGPAARRPRAARRAAPGPLLSSPCPALFRHRTASAPGLPRRVLPVFLPGEGAPRCLAQPCGRNPGPAEAARSRSGGIAARRPGPAVPPGHRPSSPGRPRPFALPSRFPESLPLEEES
ncbi:hypothetical protein ACFQ3Z_07345 [Streptomyces nogalater]